MASQFMRFDQEPNATDIALQPAAKAEPTRASKNWSKVKGKIQASQAEDESPRLANVVSSMLQQDQEQLKMVRFF